MPTRPYHSPIMGITPVYRMGISIGPPKVELPEWTVQRRGGARERRGSVAVRRRWVTL